MIKLFDVNSIKAKAAHDAYVLYDEMVNEYLELLKLGCCFQIGFSGGKDSTVVLQGAVEAMRIAIESGIIDSDQPLVAITVDTLLEPEAIQSYLPFTHENIQKYCDEHNISLHLKIVSPPIYQHLMILYAGAQKLPATAASGRNSDCSVIWKIDTSVAALKSIKESLPRKYQQSPWISISGSRSDESTRRSGNMEKQGVKGVKAQEVIDRVNSTEKSAGKTFKFAPISDWSTPDVMSYLSHVGTQPLAQTLVNERIPAFSPNFGLLLAIYGEGSNDVCSVVSLDEKTEQSGCGGKTARFGCVTCAMTSEDHSSIELKKHARWARFGDSTQRFRDFIVRISSDVKYRAFHARAYDPSTNNNVFLQPNVLKASVLEKMVWYASQITEDSKAIHLEAVKRFEAGDMDADVGVMDIMQDNTLSASVKEQYKEMYIKRLIKAPMFALFTEQHAVLLSLLWSLHGVAALPFRPAAILDNVQKGKRIPFPLTNAELNAKFSAQGLPAWNDKSRLNNTIPDALVAQIFTPAKKSFQELLDEHGDKLNESHLINLLPFPIKDASEHVTAANNIGDFSYVRNHVSPTFIREFELTYTLNPVTNEESVKAKESKSGKVIKLEDNLLLKNELLALGKNDFDEYIGNLANSTGMLDHEAMDILRENGEEVSVSKVHGFANQKMFLSNVVFTDDTFKTRQEAGKKFSARKRTYNKSTKKFEAGRSSLRVYNSQLEPALAKQLSTTVQYWVPDFSTTIAPTIDLHEAQDLTPQERKQSFVIDDSTFEEWLLTGGWDNIVSQHNNKLRGQLSSKQNVRAFFGTSPVYYITNNTGITASESFGKYMEKTLRRTEMFQMVNIFSIANLPYEKIAAYSNVVTMQEHRAQKVQHLLAVRHIKNIRRKETKLNLDDHISTNAITTKSLANITSRLKTFIAQYNEVAQTYLATTFLNRLCNVNSTRMKQMEIWFNDFNQCILSADKALNVLATQQERKLINDDFDSKTHFISIYLKEIKQLKENIAQCLDAPKALTKELLTLKKEDLFKGGADYETDKAVELSGWLGKYNKNCNRFIMAHGISKALSYTLKVPYRCPVTGANESSNTKDKIEKRYQKATQKFNECLALNSFSGPLSVLAVSHAETEHIHQSVGSITNEGKSNKLSSLMSGQLDLISKLRNQAA